MCLFWVKCMKTGMLGWQGSQVVNKRSLDSITGRPGHHRRRPHTSKSCHAHFYGLFPTGNALNTDRVMYYAPKACNLHQLSNCGWWNNQYTFYLTHHTTWVNLEGQLGHVLKLFSHKTGSGYFLTPDRRWQLCYILWTTDHYEGVEAEFTLVWLSETLTIPSFINDSIICRIIYSKFWFFYYLVHNCKAKHVRKQCQLGEPMNHSCSQRSTSGLRTKHLSLALRSYRCNTSSRT